MLAEMESRHIEETTLVVEEDEKMIRRKKAKAMAGEALKIVQESSKKNRERAIQNANLTAQLIIKVKLPNE